VGAFVLSQAMPEPTNGFSFRENFFDVYVDVPLVGIGYYVLDSEGDTLMNLALDCCQVNEDDYKNIKQAILDTGKIESIDVLSPKVRSKKGLGVGSTLSELVAAYPRYKLVPGENREMNFIAEDGVVFYLDQKGYLGKDTNTPDSDYSDFYDLKLKVSDFKPQTKAIQVHLFKP
jgi:hypothetical protein